MQGEIRKCDVCSKSPVEVWVHSLSTGAMSIASCRECLSHFAEPEFAFQHLRDFVGQPDGSGLREEVYEMETYANGKYITYRDWLKENPFNQEDYDEQMKHLEEINQKYYEENNPLNEEGIL